MESVFGVSGNNKGEEVSRTGRCISFGNLEVGALILRVSLLVIDAGFCRQCRTAKRDNALW
jgi:hypothetical protein